MVVFSNILLAGVKKTSKLRNYLKSGFRDSLRVFVSGGAGGNGLPKFGGVGGKGGDVIAVAKENITLDNVFKANNTKRYLAPPGRHASHNFILGPPGENLQFEVPVGVTIYTELGKKLGELNQDGETIIVAKGGTGGHAKNGFLGTKGQAYPINLDLKLIADIGLVGFPNAGKSTLLRSISDAKPKVASYPFTTIKPHVGTLTYKDRRQITMADLPGLIEGAYANRGMGHKFLKHVERTKLLVMIVDINGFQLSPQYQHRNCIETILLLTKELEMYNEDLLKKPSILLINKMDTEDAEKNYIELKPQLYNLKEACTSLSQDFMPDNVLKFCDIIPISAKESSDDINMVKQRLRYLLDIMEDLEGTEQNNESKNVHEDIKKSLSEKGPVLI